MNLDKKKFLRSLALNLKKLRKKRNLTQEACSEKTDVSLKYWQELESVNNTKCPSSFIAIKIARLMGVTVDDLFK
jgi:DNA-binding XRE family transcriptional regulator